jgi:DNA-binding NtrC family response regulator
MVQQSRLVGNSPFARKIVKLVSKLSQGKDDVLLLGESGTGRRTIALEIHNDRGKKRPLVLLEGASVSDGEFRAVLLGADMTPAESFAGRKPASLSDGTTLVITDIDKLAPHNQAALSSFLKDGRKKYSGLKVVSTISQHLDRLAQIGAFSAEIVAHLQKFVLVEVPPLRERLEDIGPLTDSITAQLCALMGKSKKAIGPNVYSILAQGQWPGNIRQLVGVLGKAVMISHEDDLVLPPDFLDEHQHLADAIENITLGKAFILDQSLYLIEKLLIQRGLNQFQYNQSKTAHIFGLSEANFRYRLKKFGLPSIREKV